MSKSAFVQARIEPALKDGAKKVLSSLGLTETAAISLFYAQIVHQNGIPFELKLPNAATRTALAEDLAQADSFATADDLLEACAD